MPNQGTQNESGHLFETQRHSYKTHLLYWLHLFKYIKQAMKVHIHIEKKMWTSPYSCGTPVVACIALWSWFAGKQGNKNVKIRNLFAEKENAKDVTESNLSSEFNWHLRRLECRNNESLLQECSTSFTQSCFFSCWMFLNSYNHLKRFTQVNFDRLRSISEFKDPTLSRSYSTPWGRKKNVWVEMLEKKFNLL